jgi:hypothetical protein
MAGTPLMTGKTVLVTGGIGKATAISLATCCSTGVRPSARLLSLPSPPAHMQCER